MVVLHNRRVVVFEADEPDRWTSRTKLHGGRSARSFFDLDKPILPVDTHIYRVARRLGLIGQKVSAEAAHSALQAQLAPNQIYEFHVNMIAHGRRICRAPLPRCQLCPLTGLCNYYRGHGAQARTADES